MAAQPSPAARTAEKQRDIQEQVAKADARDRAGKSLKPKAMQAGARLYPVPPFPKQHQLKPGAEYKLDPAPLYEAPFYKGSGKLEGKVALITGGDSGIGRAVAVLFAREGADVAILHLAEGRDAEDTVKAIEAEGRKAMAICGDVKDRVFCQKAVAAVVEVFGKLDVLVNTAAFQVHTADVLDLTEEHFDETLKTNLYGYFFVAQAAVPHMKEGSAIINPGSVTGIEGSKQLIDYSMTKGGIHAFTRALSGQLVPKGHPCERRRPRAGLDAAQSLRQGGEGRVQVRCGYSHEAPGTAGGNRSGLYVPRFTALLELYYRRGVADHRWLLA